MALSGILHNTAILKTQTYAFVSKSPRTSGITVGPSCFEGQNPWPLSGQSQDAPSKAIPTLVVCRPFLT